MPTTAATPISSDENTLRHLNEEYIRSFMESDVEWYRQHLAEDFQGVSIHALRTINLAQLIVESGEVTERAGFVVEIAGSGIALAGIFAVLHGLLGGDTIPQS